MIAASSSNLLDDLIWNWNFNAPVLNTWDLNINNLWDMAVDNSLPVDNSWALLAHSLVSWANLRHFSVAWNLDVHWHLYWNSNWDVHVFVFWDENFFFLDHVIWNDFLSVHWVRNWLVIETWLLHDHWDLSVDASIESTTLLTSLHISLINFLWYSNTFWKWELFTQIFRSFFTNHFI